MMIWGRIMLQFLFVITPWESLALTKKRRSVDYTGGVRSFRHISGSSSSLADWEVGLREAVLQALHRERYQDPNLRERLIRAPLIGRQDSASPFGDVAVLARGQVYGIHGGNFAFVQDPYRNDCDDCHSPRRCARHQCQPWTPHNQEQLIALWTVKRLRHRDSNTMHRYEIEYTISPINSETREIVTRRGRFNYAIPGHVFVIKSHDNSMNLPTVYNRKIPHKHFKPDILIGVDTAGYKHVLHSYPGFYTHPVHPTNNQGNNNLKENELYNKLIETLAAKTSTTTQKETPHQIYMYHYGETTKPAISANTPSVITSPLITMTHPVFDIIPTKPTMLHWTSSRVQENARPLLTTVHYFMPDGEEQLLTSEVNFKEMSELTTEREEEIFKDPSTKPNQNITPPKPTKEYYEQSNKPPTFDESTVDQLTKIEMTTGSSKSTKKYYKTKITKPKTTKHTTPKTTYIKPHITSNKKPSTTKPKSTTHISTTTKFFSTSKSSPITTSKSTIISTPMTEGSTSMAATPTTTTLESPTKPKKLTTASTSGTTEKITNINKVMPVAAKRTSTTPKTTSTMPISTDSSKQTPQTSTTTTLKSSTKPKVTTPTSTYGTTKKITINVMPAASQRTSTTLKTTSTTPISIDSSKQTPGTSPKTTTLKSPTKPNVSTTTSTLATTMKITTKVMTATSQRTSTTLKTTSTTPISTESSKQTPGTSPKTTTLKSPTKPKVSTTTSTFGTTKKITMTTKVMPATSQRTSTTLQTTSSAPILTAPISTDSSKQTSETAPSTTKKETASKSTVPSILSMLLHTTPETIKTAISETTSSTTPSTTSIFSTIQTLSKFPTPTTFTHFDITSKSSLPTITTEIAKSPSTSVASSTLEVTTELPITIQEIEEPENFPKPTKPMKVIPVRPSDEPEPSNQMSAPGEENETTPFSNTLMTTTKLTDRSVSAGDEIEKTTKTTMLESTNEQFMMEMEKPITTVIVESTKVMNMMKTTEHTPKDEAILTIEEFHLPTELTATERSSTVQSDESTEDISKIDCSNRTATTESLPGIETTIEIEDMFTSTQANTDKLTQNISNIEITTQESTTQSTTKQTSQTTRKHPASSKKPTIPNDFLIDAEPVKEPIHTKPAKQEYNLDDIFGPTLATTKPTLTHTNEPIESDLAQQLFGEKMSKNYEVIYSNFYEPSTAPTLMKYDETTIHSQPLTSQSYDKSIRSYKVNRSSETSDETMNVQPLTSQSYETSISYKVNRPSDTSDETMNVQPITSQSYETSISYKVNRPNDTSDEPTMNFQPLTSQSYETSISYKVNRPTDKRASSESPDIKKNLKVAVSGNTEDSHTEDLPDDKYVNSTTESEMTKRNFSTKKDFDELAMQLVNHARIIDYGSKTSRAKYKRRRTRKPKTRQLTKKKKKLETTKNS